MAETKPATDYIELSKTFTLVQIESPVNAPTIEGIEENLKYLSKCILDCLKQTESPYASAMMLASRPDLLDDNHPESRTKGIAAGFSFIPFTAKTVVYLDRGLSRGMKAGIEYAKHLLHPVVYRFILPPEQRINQESVLGHFVQDPFAK
jgi:hypothetical protein